VVAAGLLLEGMLEGMLEGLLEGLEVAVPGGGMVLLLELVDLALVLLPLPLLLLLRVVLLDCCLLVELLELLAAGGLNE
jgi:hypothetical protein